MEHKMGKNKSKKKDKKVRPDQNTEVMETNPEPATSESTTKPGAKMKRKEFDKELEKLQVELVKMQEWVTATGAKVCVVFEGRDTAGKGGVIKRITERTSPRVFRHIALPAPTERQKTQMYFQRYMPYLPAGGEVTIFDRSWYNRAGVERVMGFASEEEVEYFLKYAPSVEQSIIHSGIILIKYWLEVSMENQDLRLRERDKDGRKIWKLSPMDMKSYSHWYDYSRARDAMFAATDTPESPWHVVDSNDKRRARLNLITHLLSQVPYEEVPRKSVKFPKRQAEGDYVEPDYPYRWIPEIF
jgi:polyphosphate kinase 2